MLNANVRALGSTSYTLNLQIWSAVFHGTQPMLTASSNRVCVLVSLFLSPSQSSQRRFIQQEQPHLQLSYAGQPLCWRWSSAGVWPAGGVAAEVRDHAVLCCFWTQVHQGRGGRYCLWCHTVVGVVHVDFPALLFLSINCPICFSFFCPYIFLLFFYLELNLKSFLSIFLLCRLPFALLVLISIPSSSDLILFYFTLSLLVCLSS